MDIEELRARAMASMPNKKRKRKQPPLHPLSSWKFISTNNLFDRNGTELQVSSALSVPFVAVRKMMSSYPIYKI